MYHYEKIPLQRGKFGYACNGFLYYKHRVREDGDVEVQCRDVNKLRCKGRGVVHDSQQMTTQGEHNHARDDEAITKLKFKATLKASASASKSKRHSLRELFDMERQNFAASSGSDVISTETIATLPTFASVKDTLRRARCVSLPPNPKDRPSITFDNFQEQLLLPGGETMLLEDTGPGDTNRILLFGFPEGIDLLASSAEWYIDGTFGVVPQLFYQLVTIHAAYCGRQIPCVFALLPSKQERAYEKTFALLFSQFAKHMKFQIKLQTIVSDFESGIISSIRQFVPFKDVTHRGCFFHYNQAIYRHVAAAGHSGAYKNEAVFRQRIRMFAALGLVPLEDKRRYFDLLIQQCADDDRVLSFAAMYFEPTWFKQFELKIWNWFQVSVRTNNAVESYHARLNRVMGPHAGFFRFVDHLKTEIAYARAAMSESLIGEIPKKNRVWQAIDRRIQSIMREYGSREPLNYLRGLQYNLPKAKNMEVSATSVKPSETPAGRKRRPSAPAPGCPPVPHSPSVLEVARVTSERALDISTNSDDYQPQIDGIASTTGFSADFPDLCAFDVRVLQDDWELYTDSIMKKASQILQHQFPLVSGLEDPVVLHHGLGTSTPDAQYVQIVFISTDHWITISNIFCDDASRQVDVFDSFFETINDADIRKVRDFHGTVAGGLDVRFVRVQKQTNIVDCGPFALAFAVAICFQIDPHKFRFEMASADEPSIFRSHIMNCIKANKFEMFPGEESNEGGRIRRKMLV